MKYRTETYYKWITCDGYTRVRFYRECETFNIFIGDSMPGVEYRMNKSESMLEEV